MVRQISILAALVALGSSLVIPSPTGLLCEHRGSPALGIDARQPLFNWVVPHLTSCLGPNQMQHSYQLQIATEPNFVTLFWDSQRITSNDAKHSPSEVLRLLPGRSYYWRVKTWSIFASHVCESHWSSAAKFTTALWNGFANQTKAIWSGEKNSRYTLFRKDVMLAKPAVSAIAHVTAAQSGDLKKLLGAYRLFIGGETVGIGPGRSEVYVKDKAHAIYDTIDVTKFFQVRLAGRNLSLALQCFHADGGDDAKVLLEIHVAFHDGSEAVVSTDESWLAFDARDLFKPASQSTGPGYMSPEENINGSAFPGQASWTTDPPFQAEGAWQLAVERTSFTSLKPKPTLPIAFTAGFSPRALDKLSDGHYFFDFGEEMMGGIRMELPPPVPAGLSMQLTLSEELVAANAKRVLYPMRTKNHYRHVWTTGAGSLSKAMVLENHEYMLFRYGELKISKASQPSDQTATCNKVDENHVISIRCGGPTGRVISSISFASYGTPSGSCNAEKGNTFRTNETCHAKNSQEVVEKMCLQKLSCVINASSDVFRSDPCRKTVKMLAVNAACAEGPVVQRMDTAAATRGDAEGRSTHVDGHASELLNFSLGAWKVQYPWVESDSHFDSSDAMLNQVWKLCRDTLRITSLDTATDSNTRERLPYEADGAITGGSRYVFQREFMWQRHSSAHNFQNPTWPTEWRQFMPLMAFADYMQTGDTSLFEKFYPLLYNSTQANCMNSNNSNLIDFSKANHHCLRSCEVGKSGCRDIIDWPADTRDGYVLSDVSTVINAFAVKGLQSLAVMSNATGKQQQAQDLQQKSKAVSDGINSVLWNKETGLYVDGVGSESARTHSAWHAQTQSLWAHTMDPSKQPKLLEFLKMKRMAGSVYGAYAFLMGLYEMGFDHGNFALEMMTNCDESSWCHMLKVGATATMEAWSRKQKPNLSWSHPWATAPASAIAQGFMGLKPLATKFKRFLFKPQPGNATSGSIVLPTFSGAIHASFEVVHSTSFTAKLQPPPNTAALVCLPKGNAEGMSATALKVDGKTVVGYLDGDYVCIDGIGSAASQSQWRVIERKWSTIFI